MSRDYAKKKPRPNLKRYGDKGGIFRRWRAGIIWVIVLTSFFGVIFKEWRSRFPVSFEQNKGAQEEVQFDFYPKEHSPQLKSPAPLVSTNASASPQSIEKKTAVGQYILQLGTFQSENEAAEMRVSLLLAGWDVNLVQKTVEGHIQYQVEQGPYSSLEQAKAAQKTLQRQGLASLIKE